MDIYDFVGSLQEYALDSQQYKQWREIHGKTFGDVFYLAFEESQEAQLLLTAALIKISKRDYNGGLEILGRLEGFCLCEADSFTLNYFIGLCYELIGNEEQMKEYYEKIREQNVDYSFVIVFHPYYRTAKFAGRRSENEKSLYYYKKAMDFYSGQETSEDKRKNIGQLYYEMATVCLSCKDYKKSRQFIERSCEYSPEEHHHRNYVTAILCAVEGNRAEAEKIVNNLPDYLKKECQRLISSV